MGGLTHCRRTHADNELFSPVKPIPTRLANERMCLYLFRLPLGEVANDVCLQNVIGSVIFMIHNQIVDAGDDCLKKLLLALILNSPSTWLGQIVLSDAPQQLEGRSCQPPQSSCLIGIFRRIGLARPIVARTNQGSLEAINETLFIAVPNRRAR